MDLYLRDVTYAFGERPNIAFTISGGRRLPKQVRPKAFDDRECRGLAPDESAVCRARAAVQKATDERDVPLGLCFGEISVAIEALAPILAESRRRIAKADSDPEVAKREHDRQTTLSGEVQRFSAKLDECAPDYPVFRVPGVRAWIRGPSRCPQETRPSWFPPFP